MTVTTPGRPETAPDRELEQQVADLEALIEEARSRTRRRRRRLAAFGVLFVVAAGAVYFGLGHGGGGARSASAPRRPEVVIKPLRHPRNGPLALIANGGIDDIRLNGASTTIWRCPHAVWCGEQVSIAWAPDGRHLVLTMDEIGGKSTFPGMHIVDMSSQRDIRVPSGAPASGALSSMPWQAYFAKMRSTIGCFPATDLAWSPDGSSLAYRCNDGTPHINVLRLDGSSFRTIATGAAFWPSWSPTSTRIAYSTSLKRKAGGAIYTIALDGSRRRLLARDGAAPAWSPNGKVIAYQTSCGIRLVTPTGRDVTPGHTACGIGLSGPPVWSPDGTKIAFETSHGNFVMNENGSHLRLVVMQTSVAHYGQQPGRAAWRPLPRR